MGPLLIIVISLLLLLLFFFGICLLLIRSNHTDRDFYGLADWQYAHRGLHNIDRNVPENSKRAFQLALRYGYGAELDVHLSRDKRLVIMHDESLKRTAGLDMRIADANTEVLQRLRLEGTSQEIPFLEEILPMFEGKAPLIIEIKPCGKNYARLTYRVCKLLDQYPGVRCCLESFDPRVLIWLKKNRPEMIRGQLSMNHVKDPQDLKKGMAFLMTNLLFNWLAQPDFIAYKYEDRKNLSLQLCRLLWRTQEFSWTIHSQEDVDKLTKKHALVIFEGFAAKKEPLPEPEPKPETQAEAQAVPEPQAAPELRTEATVPEPVREEDNLLERAESVLSDDPVIPEPILEEPSYQVTE